MVEVFKTNVQVHMETALLGVLSLAFPHCRINFDLEDCDRILRLEGMNICNETVIQLLNKHNCHCEVLD